MYSVSNSPRRLAKVVGDGQVEEYPAKKVEFFNGESQEIINCVQYYPWFGNLEEDFDLCYIITIGPKMIHGFMESENDEYGDDDDDDGWNDDWFYDPITNCVYSKTETQPYFNQLAYGYYFRSDYPTDIISINNEKLTRTSYNREGYGAHSASIEGIGPAFVCNYEDIPRKISPSVICEVHVPGMGNPVTETDFLRNLELYKFADEGKNNIFQWPETLRTDRVWVYGILNENDGSYVESYCRFGDWEKKGLCMYRPFYEYKRMYWPDVTKSEAFTSDNGGHLPVAYLREEVGRIHFPNDENESKGIIYDFNEPSEYYSYSAYECPNVKDATFALEPSDKENWSEPEFSHIEIAGESRAKVKMKSSQGYVLESIEGIGVINRGFLPYIYGDVDDIAIPYLARYCDGNETTLCEFAKRPWDESNVETLGYTEKRTDMVYDLHGRPVANPQPGSIYIRNDRKIVMPAN